MAARSVFKLFSKTCSYSINPACASSTSPLEDSRKVKTERSPRSYSQPRQRHLRSESFIPIRKISRSLENIKDDEVSHADEYEVEPEKTVVYSEYRQTAKEFKDRPPEPEQNEEGNPIYELSEGAAENVFDVRAHILEQEQDKPIKLFPHLQPSNIKPYGSNENLFYPELFKRRHKIVYPVVTTTSREAIKRRKFDSMQQKDFSSFHKQQTALVVVPPEDQRKNKNTYDVTSKSQRDVSRMSYSTCHISKKPSQTKPPKLTTGAFIRKSNSSLNRTSSHILKKKKFPLANPSDNRLGIMQHLFRQADAYKQLIDSSKRTQEKFLRCDSRGGSTKNVLLKKPKNNPEGRSFNTLSRVSKKLQQKTPSTESFLNRSIEEITRSFNTLRAKQSAARRALANKSEGLATYSKPTDSCHDKDEFVTVKLSELKEECIRQKKCKPKKICFGTLPKFVPANCPCIEDTPLKEGKPLNRLKKRFDIAEKPKVCHDEVCDTPRADANYKIQKKSLPQLTLKECPCIEKEYIDFTIKRLPKKKLPEPPKICPCVDECCFPPPRADADLKICPKTLPKLQINNCPCIEPPAPVSVPLSRLKPKPVKEPEKICIETACDETDRADANLKVEKKQLPKLKADCVCVEPPPMLDVCPLPRLRRKEVKTTRKVCPPPPCHIIERADDKCKPKPKPLRKFVPQNCPCIEEEPPHIYVKIKRLKPRNVPKPKERICIEEDCGPRADDGLVVKPKQLPKMVPKECPCVPVEMIDTPPLKRLVPKPVKEPEKICVDEECHCEERADGCCLKVEKKSLPKLPPGNCPCIEEEPLRDVPLPKLKRRPVKVQQPVCHVEDPCPPRADENLRIKVRKLPKLQINDCPCIEAPAPEDVPLPRLRKKHVPEPARICPTSDPCLENKRADDDDWLYWKRVEVGCSDERETESDPCKTTKRSFSTRARFNGANFVNQKKFFSTSSKSADFFDLKYDISRWGVERFRDQVPSVLIDIKPSAPLILAQAPVKLSSDHAFVVKRTRSEPIDCIAFVIYRSNSPHNPTKSANEGFNTLFNRFISTCSTLYEYSEKKDSKENIRDCPCPPLTHDKHLQPKNPIIEEKETFIKPFPDENLIDSSIKKSRKFQRTRRNKPNEPDLECADEEKALCEIEAQAGVPCPAEKKETLWERIVCYFKARPDCPSPEEFKKMRLREDAERAAEKAGLCLYDPKEMLRKNENEMPKVITAYGAKDECKN